MHSRILEQYVTVPLSRLLCYSGIGFHVVIDGDLLFSEWHLSIQNALSTRDYFRAKIRAKTLGDMSAGPPAVTEAIHVLGNQQILYWVGTPTHNPTA
jgi:hypothetical protein